jgi:hypothetical protein
MSDIAPSILARPNGIVRCRHSGQAHQAAHFEIFDARGGNLACVSAALLRGDIFLRDFPKGAVEHGMIVFEQNANFWVFVDCLRASRLQVVSAKRNGLVSVVLRQLHAAVEIAMSHIAPPEDDEAGIQ